MRTRPRRATAGRSRSGARRLRSGACSTSPVLGACWASSVQRTTMESHTVPSEPTVRIDALETFVELLSRVEADPSSDAFYSRLCEATCRLADMDRAVIFRYDGARRRVRAAGSFGIPLEIFADAQVTVETVPVARDSLLEDRVIEISSAMAEGVPDEFKDLIPDSTLVCTP